MNPQGFGRGAITGQGSDAVWDFLRLNVAGKGESFTRYPHLTLAIEDDRSVAAITIPNGLSRTLVRKLKSAGYAGFKSLIAEFLRNVQPILKAEPTATPIIIVVQRRYPSQRSIPIRDADLEFDPRTAIDSKNAKVKLQEQWLQAAFDAFANKRSNIQIAIGVRFPYRDKSRVRNAHFIDLVEQSFIACKPFLTAMGLTPSK
jgi:hypothetical protein